VAPQIRYFDEPDIFANGAGVFSYVRALGLHDEYRAPPRDDAAPEEVTFVSGCCVLLRASVLRTLGGFNESYFAYVEDVELSLRFRRAGERLVYAPAARVRHKAKRRERDSAFQITQRDRNRRRLVGEHYTLLQKSAFAGWFYPTRLAHAVRFALERDWARARAIVTGAFGRLRP